jgi:hypothetical protein
MPTLYQAQYWIIYCIFSFSPYATYKRIISFLLPRWKLW